MTERTTTAPVELALQLAHAQTLLSRRIDRELSAHHGVSFNDFILLLELLRAPGQRLRRVELAERVGLSPSGVTRALIPLERIGLVTRESDPRDARVGFAVLTDVGRERTEEIAGSASLAADRIFGDWSPRQREQAADVVARLSTSLSTLR